MVVEEVKAAIQAISDTLSNIESTLHMPSLDLFAIRVLVSNWVQFKTSTESMSPGSNNLSVAESPELLNEGMH